MLFLCSALKEKTNAEKLFTDTQEFSACGTTESGADTELRSWKSKRMRVLSLIWAKFSLDHRFEINLKKSLKSLYCESYSDAASLRHCSSTPMYVKKEREIDKAVHVIQSIPVNVYHVTLTA